MDKHKLPSQFKIILIQISNFLHHIIQIQIQVISDSPAFFSSFSWLFIMALKLPLHFPSPPLFFHRNIAPFKHTGRRFGVFGSNASSQVTANFRSKSPDDINVLVTGSTGYIGKFVVRELARRGFNVIAVARERSGIRGRDDKNKTLEDFSSDSSSKSSTTTVCFSDVTDSETLNKSIDGLDLPIDVVVCCLASRNGGVKDSWKIDYKSSLNSLVAGRRRGATHFVLLSAICVQRPSLEFQRAKLKFEEELVKEAERCPDFSYSIVRPTAFFKSLGGQVESVKSGGPYVMFGDGELCACKPISEEDLASFMADCVLDDDKMRKILPIGGPGKALTPLEQGEMLFRLIGKKPIFLKVPIGVMDFSISILDFLVKNLPWLNLEDAAEFGKIGRYYAAESMLIIDPETGKYDAEKTPSYGKDTLEDFFRRVISNGMQGQELGEQNIF